MAAVKQKLLLMGKSGAGKTSMRSIIFANYVPRETSRLGATIDVEHSNIRFLGSLTLSLWDCGGQDHFIDNFLEAEQENVFKDVAVLIYVFDAESMETKDTDYFRRVCDAIYTNSRSAKIFCLVHKMDLINENEREEFCKLREAQLKEIGERLDLTCFWTSIWDETLYKAWSEIVRCLISNLDTLKAKLRALCEVCEADEVVIFERATFLVIAHAVIEPHDDVHRFEKISNIIKQFKLSCNKKRAGLESLLVQNANSTVLILDFTVCTSIMLVCSDTRIRPAAVLHNIQLATEGFKPLLDDAPIAGSDMLLEPKNIPSSVPKASVLR
mmetsp:Transcript_30850/g.118265  ORF Transcript_30850/g.118265 Transcript_30850/m.118265 type:complete len:327 (-) Transcript_30850:3013-3993(-)